MNVFDIPIVRRCCDASTAINDYFLEERYVVEVDQNELLTPNFLSILALNLLLDEVADIGIETDNTAEDLLVSPFDIDVLFYYREKLDKDNLYSFLKSLSEYKYSEFCGVIENCTTAEDMLIEMTDFMNNTIPTDAGWDFISKSLESWCSTEAFAKHINAIQSKIDIHADKNKTYITDDNVMQVANFLKKMKQRAEKIKRVIMWIEARHQVDKTVLSGMLNTYDKDKLRPDLLPLFAEYDATHPEKEPQYLKDHHLTIYHHYEYWEWRYENKDKVGGFIPPTKEEYCMILGSLVLDGLRGEAMGKEVKKFEKFGGEGYKLISSIYAEDWDAVLRGDN